MQIIDTRMMLTKMLSWTAASTALKIGGGLLTNKLLATAFGPSGVGQAGGMLNFIGQLDTLSGAGIVNGVNKYVAEFHDHPRKLRRLLGTASTITGVFATLLALLLVFAEAPLGCLMFEDADCRWLIKAIAAIQFAIAGANLLRALLKGQGDAVGNSLSSIGGTLLGIGAYCLSVRRYGYCGALLGLALVPAWPLVPASVLFYLRNHLSWRWLRPTWNFKLAHKLSRFSVMTVINSVACSIAVALLRYLLITHYSWDEVGLWQGMRKISDSYFQITTSFLSVYLLPLLSYSQDKKVISQAILSTLRFIFPIALSVGLVTWILRDHVINWLFDEKFAAMRDLFAWQLTGDILRIGTAIFGSLFLGKALLFFYLLSEVGALVLMSLFSCWLIPHYGAMGAAQAHLATYLVYFSLCLAVGYYYRQQR